MWRAAEAQELSGTGTRESSWGRQDNGEVAVAVDAEVSVSNRGVA